MSKSKRNTVDPGAIIARYGADTARWFILSDNPPERDMEWTEAGVAGAFRFTQRLFRLAEAFNAATADEQAAAAGPRRDWSRPRGRQRRGGSAAGYDPRAAARALRQATHRTIAAVTTALDSFAFNVAVARLYELANAIGDAERAPEEPGLRHARFEALETLCRLVAPMMPHLAEEMHARLRADSAQLVAELPWPEADPAFLATESVTIAVQVMGKLRGTIAVPPDAAAARVSKRRRRNRTWRGRYRASAWSSASTCRTAS